MKRLLSILAITLIIFSCEQPEKTLSISGNITNPAGEQVTFRFADSSYKATVDSLGAFQISIAFDSAQYGLFIHGQERSELFLLPNSQLSLVLDTKQFDETLKLSGNNAEPSNYLLSKYLLEEQLPDLYQRMRSDDPMTFLAVVDSTTQLKNEHLNSFQNSLPIEFFVLEQAKIRYEKIVYLTSLLNSFAYQKKELPENPEYYTYRKEIDYNNEDLLNISSYERALTNEISVHPYQNLNWNDPDSRLQFFNSYIDVADSLIDSESVLSSLLLSHIDSYKSYIDIDVVESKLEAYKAIFNQRDYSETKEVLSQIRALSPGSDVPDFAFTSLSDENVNLSDFKGNIIYIDLWATWCGPCIAEQPAMEVLVEQYKADPVVFLAISTDSSPAPWKKMVAERELAGTHVYAENAWKADIMQHFIVEGIPRYILLDTEGRIINQNAPRPSGNISEILDQELEKI